MTRKKSKLKKGQYRCSKCKVIKDTSLFSKDSGTPRGHKSQCKECCSKRDKHRRKNGGIFPKEIREIIFERDNHECQICGSTEDLECDHKFPQHLCKKGTASCLENGWLLCKSCNTSKGTKVLKEVLQKMHIINFSICQ